MTILNAVLFALAAFAASGLVLGAAWAIGRGRAAALRHLIWTGAFAVLLALPLAALLVPSQLAWQLEAAPVAAPVSATPVAAPTPGIAAADIVVGVAAIWLAGALFQLGKLAIGGIGLIVLHRRSVPHIPRDIDAAPFHGLGWQLRLRTAPSAAGPLTWGIVRPVVLLPKASVAWPRERLTSVLLHEAAHVRRKDCLTRLIAVLACALYWPNPLVWFAARAQRADGESAADDAVLSMGVRPTRYAEHLVGLAREFSGGSYAMTLSMADRAALGARVKSILDPNQSRTGVTKMDVLKIAALGLTLTSALALARPSLAEAADDPAPAAAPSQDASPPVTDDKPVMHRIERRIVLRNGPPEPPEAPPAPPALDALPPPAPPAPGVIPPPPPPAPVRTTVRVEISDADKAALRQLASADAKRAMAQARKAIADAHIDRVIAEAMKKAEDAMAKGNGAEAEAQKAMAADHIDKVVEEAMKKAEVALKNARVKITVVKKRLDKDGAGPGDELPDPEN